jgi:hypothetical protein
MITADDLEVIYGRNDFREILDTWEKSMIEIGNQSMQKWKNTMIQYVFQEACYDEVQQ